MFPEHTHLNITGGIWPDTRVKPKLAKVLLLGLTYSNTEWGPDVNRRSLGFCHNVCRLYN